MTLCRTAQLLNFSSLAGDCGISQPTVKTRLRILRTGFLVFRLPALRSNLRKRLVKMPKLHFHDTGLAYWLPETAHLNYFARNLCMAPSSKPGRCRKS